MLVPLSSYTIVQLSQQRIISVEIRAWQFPEDSKLWFTHHNVYQPVENFFFCCEGPATQFVQLCHTQVELQQLNMVIF